MKKEKEKFTKRLFYYDGYQETVLRPDESRRIAFTRKMHRKRLLNVLRSIVCIISAFALLTSGSILAKRGIDKLIFTHESEAVKEDKIPADVVKKLEDMTQAEAWAYLYGKYPELMNITFPPGMSYEYALFYAKNPQIIGYLKINGTGIDAPIPQAENNDYYLNHDFYGKYTSYGAIFCSGGHNMKELDRNTLIYGHNMKDGSRFAALTRYKSLDYYKSHPSVEFDTLYNKHTWKIYAVFITNGGPEGDDGYFFDFTYRNCSTQCFLEYIDELDKRKLYETGVDLLPTDKILTLCTCSYEFKNARLVIVARMTRQGENGTVDTSKAAYKSTPIKYPAAYYSKPSKNPYKNDAKWYLY